MTQFLILGMGASRADNAALAKVLSRQPGAGVSHEQPPFLPWGRSPGQPGIRERIERLCATRAERVIGDVAAYYLPYAEEAVAAEPGVRILCLKRPRAQTVAELCASLDHTYPLPINHWAKQPAAGWHHDPVWTRTFRQYDVQDREEGVRHYWDEYYTTADDLAGRFPENVRVFDAGQALATEDGLRELLTFAGIPREQQVVEPVPSGDGPSPGPPLPSRVLRSSSSPYDPRKCIVLVPYTGQIVQPCQDALAELERRGYRVRRVAGFAAIDQGRNQLATDALAEGFEETMWIDADIGFHPDAVDRLRAHRLPIACGIYAQKMQRAIACHLLPGTPSLVFGREGSLREIMYAGAGFLLVRREVYTAVQERLTLPVCNERFGRPMVPYFQPMVQPCEDGHWYLAEDYAFCQRARDCGFKVMADTTLRLWHYGLYGFGWEDSGRDRERHGTFTLNFTPRDGVREEK